MKIAPEQCLQWYTEASGTLTSFNYRFAAMPAVQHLAYQDYNICIRQNQVRSDNLSKKWIGLKSGLSKQGFCGIGYSACSTPPAAAVFLISGAAADPAVVTATSLADANCWTDWLQIPCASDQMNSVLLSASTAALVRPCVSKICGAFFSAVDSSAASSTVYSESLSYHYYCTLC